MSFQLAKRMTNMRPSTIREILKATARPEIISLAGGLPAPELFPVHEINAACSEVLKENGPGALQYGESEGYFPLRSYIATDMARRHIDCAEENVLITSGSQQVLDLVGKVLLDSNDVVLTENPTYLAAIQAFQTQEARFVPVPTDHDGIIPDELPALISKYKPKLLYTIPNFQNPTGITLTEERRRAVYEIASSFGLPIVEDDPYGRLRYKGDDIPPIKSLDKEGLVIYVSTYSKTIAPGLRLGWTIAGDAIMKSLLIVKQASDLHTSSLDQMVAHKYLTTNDNDVHVERVRKAYGERYAIMDRSLLEYMPDGVSWTKPDGGMFLWVSCPRTVDTKELLPRAIEDGVLYVPGSDFFPDAAEHHLMRLNFSNSTPERISSGVQRLAELLREQIRVAC